MRVQLQTQLNPTQIEILFAGLADQLQSQGASSTNLTLNLREISQYNFEIIKERFRHYTENIQTRFEENTQEIYGKRGLYNQGVLIESQKERVTEEIEEESAKKEAEEFRREAD